MDLRNICRAVRVPFYYFPVGKTCQSFKSSSLTDLLGFNLGQSFEGGISGSPGVEAHGAYAFCALACLSMLGPPEETIPRYA
jgi:protein farnesyltransferase subunit beta